MAICLCLALMKVIKTSNLLIQPYEVDPNSSNALFASSRSQGVDRIKRYSETINIINSPSTGINENDPILDNTRSRSECWQGESIAKH